MAFEPLLVLLLSALPSVLLSQPSPSCSPGFYLFPKNSTCLPCPAGYFNPLSGTMTINVCSPCPQNTFSKPGASKCTACPKRTAAPAGAERCLACPAGTEPKRCIKKYYGDYPNEVPGKCTFSDFYDEITRPAGPLRCVPCYAGSFSKRSSAACQPCPEGTKSFHGADSCLSRPCPPGKGMGLVGTKLKCESCISLFNDGSFHYCKECPKGFTGNKRADSTGCVPCPAGTRGDYSFCKRCKPGENSYVTGATFCMTDNTECASNFFRNARGACQRCTKAERYNPAKRICEPCGSNAQSKGGLDRRCYKCPPGTSVPEETQLFSLNGDFTLQPRCECKEGFQRMPDGQCKPCPPGFKRSNAIPWNEYSGDDRRQLICYACISGLFAPKPGAVHCLKCPAGLVAVDEGQTRCTKCPKGLRPNTIPASSAGSYCVNPLTGERVTKRDYSQQEYCKGNFFNFRRFLPGLVCDCVSVVVSKELVNGECRYCPAGTIGTFGASGCTPCPAGTFQRGRGKLGCHFCPAGMVSKTGAEKCKPCPKGTTTFGVGEANCVKPGGLK